MRTSSPKESYSEPMFKDGAALDKAAPDNETEDRLIQASMIWRMEPEEVGS